ncbi:MAG: molecular chaperone HtpG [Chloroflexota bacterium]|nr:MAG: molecular chaperone HtpG [Chloroflexota bacterium]
MSDQPEQNAPTETSTVAFKAEIRQLLNILIHSLYTEKEIFLRELISNASDALNRMRFELLTNRNVLDPDIDLFIRIRFDPDQRLLTIQDTGIGMTREELVENLGTIAHSGVRAFIEAAQEGSKDLSEVIGQFGVGFYSVFMVAEWVKVTSRSYRPEAEAATWHATGTDTYTIGPGSKESRGTTIEILLKEDAAEFAKENRLRETIRKHSDYVAFPIYFNDGQEQVNRQTALWRTSPREVTEEQYDEFYKQFTLEPKKPLLHVHVMTDAPVQVFAVLYVPASAERGLFSLRKDEGLKLYSRKVLIREYTKDLLPEYFRFVQGVVDSEDLPLNVSREAIQSSAVMGRLKKILTSELVGALKNLAQKDAETYNGFWLEFGRYVKEGIATDHVEREKLYPLLRFRTNQAQDSWSSLADYIGRMKPNQTEIYYLLGDDERSVTRSPHLDYFQQRGYEVIVLTDPIDSFMVLGLTDYEGHKFRNAAASDLTLPEEEGEKPAEEAASIPENEFVSLVERFKNQLGERVTDVRATNRLSNSVARLVDPEGALNQEMQRVYRLVDRDFEAPKKVLELNPRHKILQQLKDMPPESELSKLVIEQIYESALLIEGLHPDPAGMIPRIQQLMEAALQKS